MFPCLRLHVIGIPETENGNLRLLATNRSRDRKRKFVFLGWQRMVLQKTGHLWLEVSRYIRYIMAIKDIMGITDITNVRVITDITIIMGIT
jgi:hypothetical protein